MKYLCAALLVLLAACDTRSCAEKGGVRKLTGHIPMSTGKVITVVPVYECIKDGRSI